MGLISSLNTISSAMQTYIVAPTAAFGMAGFVFSAQGEAFAQLAADITDHYSEDNKALQDHIAIHPKRITLKGFVGELTYSRPGASASTLNVLTEKLTVISAFLPSLSTGAQTIQQGITNPTNLLLSSSSNLYGLVKNILGATGNTKNQQNAYVYFKSLMETATLMGVQTPWEFMTNMAIESIIAIQDDKSIYVSDFAVTFKQIRIASTTTFMPVGSGSAVPTAPVAQGDAAIQKASVTNLGNTPGAALPSSLLAGAQGAIQTVNDLFDNPRLSSIFKFVSP